MSTNLATVNTYYSSMEQFGFQCARVLSGATVNSADEPEQAKAEEPGLFRL